MLAAAVLPIGLVWLAGPLLSMGGRLFGHEVSGGAVTVNPFIGVVMPVGFLITAMSILVALTRRSPIERPRYAPLPLTCACAVLAATAVASPLAPSAPAWIAGTTTFGGLIVGALAGHRVATSLLDLRGLPITTESAPPEADRYPIARGSTAVWTGRVSPLRSTTWLIPIAVIAAEWLLLHERIPVMVGLVAIPLLCVLHALGRTNRRLRVTIGPSGVQLRSGLFNHLRQSISLEHITAASITNIEHAPGLLTEWRSTTRRLTIATRKGPALSVSLAEGTELIISMINPAEPAGLINSLLDQRASIVDTGDTSRTPPC